VHQVGNYFIVSGRQLFHADGETDRQIDRKT